MVELMVEHQRKIAIGHVYNDLSVSAGDTNLQQPSDTPRGKNTINISIKRHTSV